MKTDGRKKTYKIHHESPFFGEFASPLRFILLPFGNSYGDVPRNAGHGDRIRFLNGDEAEILSVCICEMNTKLMRILALMRYNATLDYISKNWELRAQAIGAKREAIDNERCLMIWHSKRLYV